MKRSLFTVLATLLIPAASFAATSWNQLDSTQKAEILAGHQVVIDASDSSAYWQATVYQWVHQTSRGATPRGDAAVFWDLPGQAAYQPGLLSFNITAGLGSATVSAEATVTVPTPTGPVVITYPQENSLFRSSADREDNFSISWHTTDPARPLAPGFLSVFGDVGFQHFPQDGGGALMAYRMVVFPIGPILQNPLYKALFLGQLQMLVGIHATRMEQGPTLLQLIRLERDLH